jgi:hypothetical protein
MQLFGLMNRAPLVTTRSLAPRHIAVPRQVTLRGKSLVLRAEPENKEKRLEVGA